MNPKTHAVGSIKINCMQRKEDATWRMRKNIVGTSKSMDATVFQWREGLSIRVFLLVEFFQYAINGERERTCTHIWNIQEHG
jgi:hypothetical protein